jgi:hypothetical protein
MEPSRVEHLSSAPLYGRLTALCTNIRPGWDGLPRTNTILIEVGDKEKRLITLTPGVNVKKHFSFISDDEAQ